MSDLDLGVWNKPKTGVQMRCGHIEEVKYVSDEVTKRVLPGGCGTMLFGAFNQFCEHNDCRKCAEKAVSA